MPHLVDQNPDSDSMVTHLNKAVTDTAAERLKWQTKVAALTKGRVLKKGGPPSIFSSPKPKAHKVSL